VSDKDNAPDTTASASVGDCPVFQDALKAYRNSTTDFAEKKAALIACIDSRAAQPVQAGEVVGEHEQAIDLMRKLERDGLEFVCMDGSANVVGIIKAAWKYRASLAPVSAQQGAAVASSLDDLMTYSSLHGTLVRLADAKCRLAETERNLEGALRALGAENGPTFMGEPTLPARSIPNVDTMVNRFLGWSLPKDFSPDCGISFDGRKDDEWNKNKSWPTGTNLFAATQAKAMFEYCLASPASAPEAAPEQQLANDWEEDFKHENGQYEGRCSNCGCRFIGHKRRCVCKACYDRAAPTAGAATTSEDARDAARLADRVRDLIASHAADNWPMKKYALEDIEKNIRAINVGYLLEQAMRATQQEGE
jgi:hypothetical protein